MDKQPTNSQQEWRNRLRELYLTTSPDERGLVTSSILFNWGKFTFEPKEKQCEFYLTTKDSMEAFIESLITQVISEIPDKAAAIGKHRNVNTKLLKQHLTTKFLGGHNDTNM